MTSDGKENQAAGQSFLAMACSEGTPRYAAITALVVGTILILINHYETILALEFPSPIKIFLTYLVPYCVTTWGAITIKRKYLRANGLRQAQSDPSDEN